MAGIAVMLLESEVITNSQGKKKAAFLEKRASGLSPAHMLPPQ
jgi:hypothetical protein